MKQDDWKLWSELGFAVLFIAAIIAAVIFGFNWTTPHIIILN
jgi:hypothetical protein